MEHKDCPAMTNDVNVIGEIYVIAYLLLFNRLIRQNEMADHTANNNNNNSFELDDRPEHYPLHSFLPFSIFFPPSFLREFEKK